VSKHFQVMDGSPQEGHADDLRLGEAGLGLTGPKAPSHQAHGGAVALFKAQVFVDGFN
jgi:hypothetical protein